MKFRPSPSHEQPFNPGQRYHNGNDYNTDLSFTRRGTTEASPVLMADDSLLAVALGIVSPAPSRDTNEQTRPCSPVSQPLGMARHTLETKGTRVTISSDAGMVPGVSEITVVADSPAAAEVVPESHVGPKGGVADDAFATGSGEVLLPLGLYGKDTSREEEDDLSAEDWFEVDLVMMTKRRRGLGESKL